jgi:heterodisulfide reductase subunit B
VTTCYYPGCTLPQKARDFDVSARTCCGLLGVPLVEMEKWVCCGSAWKLDTENVMRNLAPVQVLLEARKSADRLMTLCVFCYNSLRRANHLLRGDAKKRAVVAAYLEKEYDGRLEVHHLLQILRDEVTFDAVRRKVRRPLGGVRAAPFYGCLLLRPHEEVGFDSAENPTVFEDLLEAVGASVVRFPHRLECCGSYLSLRDPAHTEWCARRILDSAAAAGANAIVTSCPMCNFNFEFYGRPGEGLHVFYFTEILALALGAELDLCGLSQHATDVRAFLEGVLAGEKAGAPA